MHAALLAKELSVADTNSLYVHLVENIGGGVSISGTPAERLKFLANWFKAELDGVDLSESENLAAIKTIIEAATDKLDLTVGPLDPGPQ